MIKPINPVDAVIYLCGLISPVLLCDQDLKKKKTDDESGPLVVIGQGDHKIDFYA